MDSTSKICTRRLLMETLDWTKLAADIVPDKTRIPYEPNKHLFKKVAFDVFQLSGSPVESLWTLEDGEDGPYLVAQYSDVEEAPLESKGHWAALSDKDGENITLMYKDTPIRRLASTEFGFTKEDVHIFQDAVVGKLAEDETVVGELMSSLPQSKAELLTAKFPELHIKKKVAFDWPWEQTSVKEIDYSGRVPGDKRTLREHGQELYDLQETSPDRGEQQRADIWDRLTKEIKRARGNTVTINDLYYQDVEARSLLASMGGAGYWCSDCRGGGVCWANQPCEHGWNPKDNPTTWQNREERGEAEERFGLGAGNYVERQIVQLLGGLAYMKDDKIKNILKSARKPVDEKIRWVWRILEDSALDPGNYNSAVMVMGGMATEDNFTGALAKPWRATREKLVDLRLSESDYKRILKHGFPSAVLRIQRLLEDNQVHKDSYKTVVNNLLMKIK